jgi:hypothetical protein
VDSPTLGDDATFTCRHSDPGPRSGASASIVSSNYRPNRLGFEVARGTPGDFQREQVTNFTQEGLDASITQLIDERVAEAVPVTDVSANSTPRSTATVDRGSDQHGQVLGGVAILVAVATRGARGPAVPRGIGVGSATQLEAGAPTVAVSYWAV